MRATELLQHRRYGSDVGVEPRIDTALDAAQERVRRGHVVLARK